MRAVGFRVRRVLARRGMAVAGAALVVALVGSALLGLVGGARRTGSVADAYTAAAGGEITGVIEQRSGPPRTEEVQAVPGVAEVQAITFLFGLVDAEAGGDTITFAGDPLAGFVLTGGRRADPARPHEFVADEAFLRATGARFGDRFPVRFWSSAQAERGEAFLAAPEGPIFEGTLVGVGAVPDVLNEKYRIAIFPSTLLAEDIGTVGTSMTVRMADGLDLDDLRAGVDTLPDGDGIGLGPGTIVSAEVRTAVNARARGLWVMSAVAWIAGLVVVGQLLTRTFRVTDGDRTALSALGQRRLESGAETVLRAAVPVAIGCVGAVVGAYAWSSQFPTGFVRGLELERGRRFDAVALVGGGAVLALSLLVWVGINWALSQRTRATHSHPGFLGGLGRLVPGATAGVGARFALSGRDGTARGAASSLAGLGVTMAGLSATLAFGSALDRLVTEPARFGAGYDVALGDLSGLSAAELRTVYETDPDVTGLSILSEATVRSGAETVEIVGFEPVRGDFVPPVLAGRLPSGPTEVALGRTTAGRLGVSIDDEVELAGGGRDRFRVVGYVVVPPVGGGEGVGRGGVVTPEGLARLQPEVGTVVAAVTVAPGAPPETFDRLGALSGGDVVTGQDAVASPPSAIANVAQVRSVPVALAWLLGALVALALLHSLTVSIQVRRRDVAVLRSLGAGRSWVAALVHWQATVLALVPALLGIPLGVVVGTWVFRRFAEGLGAVSEPSVPWAGVAVLVIALVAAANVVATVPARRARRTAVAEVLRAG